jgi:hypothetical protein
MAVGKHPLHFVSYSGPDPVISLDDEKFQKLESALGKSISSQARTELVAECDRYLSSRRAEMLRQTWKDVERRIAPYQAAAKAMYALAFRRDERSDAGSTLDRLMDGAFARQHLRLNAEADLLHMKPDHAEDGIAPLSDSYELPAGLYFIRMSESLLREMAMCLAASVKAAEQALEERAAEASETRHMEAIDRLILSLTTWAKINSLPISPTKNGQDPAPFAIFLAELLAMMPEEHKETEHTSAGGMAAKIRRVRAVEQKE